MDYGLTPDEYVFTTPQYTTFSSTPAPAAMSSQGLPAYQNCPHCGNECVVKYSEKNNNRPYFACSKPEYGGSCSNPKGWFKWADELNKPTSQQRFAQPPAKRQQQPQHHSVAPSPGVPRQVHVTPEMIQQSKTQQSVAASPPDKSKIQVYMDAWMLRLQQKIDQQNAKIDFLTSFITQHLSSGEQGLPGAVDEEQPEN